MSQVGTILDEARKLTPLEQRSLAEQLLARLEGGVPQAATVKLGGQVEGYWLAPHESVREAAPRYRPTGALLPPPGQDLSDDVLCLDLVFLEGAWYPLSEAGVYTYAHSSALRGGERYRFVRAHVPWASEVYEVDLAEALEADLIASRYGLAAANQARHDFPAVQLQLHRTL